MSTKKMFVVPNVDSQGRIQLLWDAASADHNGQSNWVRCKVTRSAPQYIPGWKEGDTVWVAVTTDPNQAHIHCDPVYLGLRILDDQPEEPKEGWAWRISATGTSSKYLLRINPNAENYNKDCIYVVLFSDGSGTYHTDWQSVLDWFGDIPFTLSKLDKI